MRRLSLLTQRQLDALVILAGAPRSATQLADHLGAFASPSQARSLAGALERKGYAARVSSPGGAVRWQATAAGRAALAAALGPGRSS